MDEEQFLKVIAPLPPNNEFYYVNGDLNLGEFAFSRAYIKFINIEDLLIFKEKYDDYIFIDSKGNEYPAIVEYAPMQKLPRRLNSMNIKKDTKVNTIEDDPDFIAFKEGLEAIQNGTAVIQQQQPTITNAEPSSEEIVENKTESKENNHQIPPLVEYLNKKRLEKIKIKEEKKRKRDELKKKKKDEIRMKKLEQKKETEQKKSNQPEQSTK
ncbi:Smg-4/UPF3-like protein, partial [Euroglyphus maynei]